MLDLRKNVGRGFGGGFEIALACDFRIGAESAKFASFEVRRWLHQGDGGIVRLVLPAAPPWH